MPAPRVKLMNDPRWLPFAARYAGDWVRFAVEVCGAKVSHQQIRVLRSAARPRARTSVASGHSTGKTFTLAIIVLAHLTTLPQSVGLVTANDMDQLKATLWKEVGILLEQIRRGPWGWIADHVFIGADAHCHIEGYKGTWFWESKTANEKTANKMAGRHGEWYMVIGDEAATIGDTVMTTLMGGLSGARNRALLTSQYIRNAGFFHRTQTDLAMDQGGDWDAISLSSIESPFASIEALREWRETYDSDEWLVRVLGRPPEDSDGLMMPLQTAHAMYRERRIGEGESFGWLLLADIASGEGLRDKSAAVIARVSGWGDFGPDARRLDVVDVPILTNKIRANRFAAALAEIGGDYPDITYVVDSGGLGINVCQDLEDAGKVVHRVNWGNPCFQRRNRDRYLNLRAQAMHQAARAAKEGRLAVLTSAHKKILIGQSSRIPKTWTDKGRIRVPAKGDKEWNGLGSPDLWDAVCFAFLENVQYIPASVGGGEDRVQSAPLADLAAEMFVDVA